MRGGAWFTAIKLPMPVRDELWKVSLEAIGGNLDAGTTLTIGVHITIAHDVRKPGDLVTCEHCDKNCRVLGIRDARWGGTVIDFCWRHAHTADSCR